MKIRSKTRLTYLIMIGLAVLAGAAALVFVWSRIPPRETEIASTVDVAASVEAVFGLTSTAAVHSLPAATEKAPILTPTSTQLVSTLSSTPVKPTSTPIPPTPTEFVLPDSYYIRDLSGNRQYYALGCEASAAVDLAWYYEVNIFQSTFQLALPLSDNPDLGFVGDVNGPWGQIPPYAYGVHAAPVADLLNEFGVEVEGGKGYTLDQVKRTLAESKPIIVWVIGHMEYSEPVVYTDQQGNTSIVAPYEHVVILTGYDEDSVRYLNNGKYADVPYDVFLTSWGVLGNMAVFHK